MLVVRLDQTNHGSLGFSVSHDHGIIRIVRITALGPADLDGRLKIGDHVLSVNGQTLDGVSLGPVVQMLRQPASATLAVQRRVRRVVLCRPAAGGSYGVVLRTGRRQTLVIQQIVSGSVAAGSCLKKGDCLESINGLCCVRMTCAVARTAARGTQQLVLLVA